MLAKSNDVNLPDIINLTSEEVSESFDEGDGYSIDVDKYISEIFKSISNEVFNENVYSQLIRKIEEEKDLIEFNFTYEAAEDKLFVERVYQYNPTECTIQDIIDYYNTASTLNNWMLDDINKPPYPVINSKVKLIELITLASKQVAITKLAKGLTPLITNRVKQITRTFFAKVVEDDSIS